MRLMRLGLVFLLIYMTFLLLFGTEFLFLDSFNLVMHEAGHLVFGFFGTTIMFLGGTILQILIPIVCSVALLRQNDRFGAISCIWWVGENLINVARYMSDAPHQRLQLIGGEHDWAYLFGVWGLIPYSEAIGLFVRVLGFLVMVISIGYLTLLLASAWRTKNIQSRQA